jgi:hypothetical protein
MRGVEGHDIGRVPAGSNVGCAAPAPPWRSVEQRAAVETGTAGQHVRSVFSPAIFELTQFVGDADQDIGVRADAEPAAGIKEFTGRENAVAEACFGDRAEARDGAAGGKR